MSEIDTFVYMMAAEKMVNLLFCMEITMNFMDEYQVKPDDEVKKALLPLIERINKWTGAK